MNDSNKNSPGQDGKIPAQPAQTPPLIKKGEGLTEKTWRELDEILSTLKYGSITLIIQDSKVIQIEKNEKIRLT
jgi:hypothetical protein